ncbi:hypothetical protein [Longibacter sp.]|jgi:hypothetical protein|uniref:hypothetical protein n=1 Tax=Longibacter sp. TaxID=2045415 RepID=UPI003EB79FE6
MPDASDIVTPYYWTESTGGRFGPLLYGLVGALAFVGMGGGVLFGAWTVYESAGMHPGIYLLGSLSVLLFAVAVWLAVSAHGTYRRRADRARRLEEHPDRPWIVRDAWQGGAAKAIGDDVEMTLASMPAVLGTSIEGRVQGPDLAVDCDASVHVTIECRRREGGSNSRSRTIWRDEQDVRPVRYGSHDVSIPVAFDLPLDAPPATPDPEGRPRVDWRLRIDDDGWDGPVLIPLPVFGTTDPASQRPDRMKAGRDDDARGPFGPALGTAADDERLMERYDGLAISSTPTECVLSFQGALARYGGSRAFAVICTTILAAIHGYIGYLQVVVPSFQETVAIPLALHAVLAPMTAFFVYRSIYPSGKTVTVTVTGDRMRASLSGSGDAPFVDVPIAQVASVSVAVADVDQPRRGYDLRLDLREPVDPGPLRDALAEAGISLDASRKEGDALDPRVHPPLYLQFRRRADAEIIAGRIEAALRDRREPSSTEGEA